MNVDLDYFYHPKIIRLCGKFGHEASIYPLRLWAYTGKFYPETGRLKGYTPQEIEAACDWRGTPGALLTALLELGFLDQTTEGYQVHDWLDHCGHLQALKKRAKIAAKARWSSIATSNASESTSIAPSNATDEPKQCSGDALILTNYSVLSKPTKLSKLTKKEKETTIRPAAPSAAAWDAYAMAYQARYQAQPVRNAKVNGQLANLVKRLGADDAPQVAAFYVTHNDSFYVRKRHPVDLLLRDAEGLRTQWITKRKATYGEAREAERHDNLREQSKRVEKMLEKLT